VELGAGEGRFARRLAELGLRPVLLDHRRVASSTCPRVCADLGALPLRETSTGLFVLANSLRHLRPGAWASIGTGLWQALAPGGAVVVLEDEP